MTGTRSLSRRNFVQLASAAALGSRAMAATKTMPTATSGLRDGAVIYVGRSSQQRDSVEVFAVLNGRMQRVQSVETAAPASLAVAADRRRLYAVNAVSSYQGLPTGTVEAYEIGDKGSLRLMNRQPLSLAATRPNHVELSPDGSKLLVTAEGGSMLNILPLASNGEIERATAIFKATGDSTGRAAQLRMGLFDRSGNILSADAGTGSLRVLGHEERNLSPQAQHAVEAEHVTLPHGANTLYALRAGTIDRYVYDHKTCTLSARQQSVAAGVTSLTTDRSGRILLGCGASNGVRSWTISADGTLRSADHRGTEYRLHAAAISPDGRGVVALSREDNLLLSASLDRATGMLGAFTAEARVDSPRSMAMMYF